MISIDTFTIVISLTLVLLAIISSLASPFLRCLKVNIKKDSTNDSANTSLPPLSIIIPAHDNEPELQRSLPSFFTQDYPASYNIIVVADKGDRDTEDLIKRFQSHNSNLYATYIPESSRYMSRKKLAITLGVKAAKTDWVIITDPTCSPADDNWLKSIAENMVDENTDIVMANAALNDETPSSWRYEHAMNSYIMMRSTQRGHNWGHNSPVIAIRKDIFMQQEGFRGNLELLRGEYDFIANKYATDNNAVIDTLRSSWLYEEEPSRKTWHNRNIYFFASRHLLSGFSSIRVSYIFSNTMLHLSFLLNIAGIVYGAMLHNWIILGAAIISMILLIVWRTLLATRIKLFDENLSTGLLFIRELCFIWRHFYYHLLYQRADKNDFTSHKL